MMVAEAGGKITTCSGGEPPLANTDMLASNGLLHDAMLPIVQRHLPIRS